ncbi:Migration and invasion enhancer 1 [Exaiptasia diaphana]|nr:Migration and invasion enhancer 1 [Exaiptasia diaphana]
MAEKVNVFIEYWELADTIKQECPEAIVDGKTGRTGSFEVSVNGREIFSKLKKGGMPEFDEIVDCVKAAGRGEEKQAENVQPSSCVIL